MDAADIREIPNRMRDRVYVLDRDGKPLMPSSRFRHIRDLIRAGKAVKLQSRPYMPLPLCCETPGITQDVILGLDPGRTNIGPTAIRENGEVLYEAHVTTRNREVPKRMEKRKTCRQTRRRHRRKKTQRRAFRNGTVTRRNCEKQKKINGTLTVGVMERILPGCEKPVPCIGILNRKARFLNRVRPGGWLTPTANQLLQTHLNVAKHVMRILPVRKIVLELNRFAFMALDNPLIQRWQYQKGPLGGFSSIREAVSAQQNGHCLFCDKDIEHDHHIVPRSRRGSNTIANLCGLCKEHHALVHPNEEWKKKLPERKAGLVKKYGALSVLNQIIPRLTRELANLLPPGSVYVTTGEDTAKFREDCGIEKSHHARGCSIACSILEKPTALVRDHSHPSEIRQLKQA